MWEVRSSIVPARVVHGRSTDPEKLCLTASTPGSVRRSSQETTRGHGARKEQSSMDSRRCHRFFFRRWPPLQQQLLQREDHSCTGTAAMCCQVTYLLKLLCSNHLQLAMCFRPCLVSKKFTQYPSHRIFGHIHEALNVVEKITNYTI